MLVSQTFKNYLNGTVQVALLDAISPPPPLRPLAPITESNSGVLACAYFLTRPSSVASIIATGEKGLSY